MGLKKTGQIGRVLIHPNDHNIVYVAAIGDPFKSNSERGYLKLKMEVKHGKIYFLFPKQLVSPMWNFYPEIRK